MSNSDLAQTVMERVEMLARISEEPDRLTRTFCSPAMRKANDLTASWMREAGMTVSEDAIGNLIGRYTGREDRAKTFLLGSHLDTVSNAGKFDGTLGVLTAIACVQHLQKQKVRLPFAIEVVALGDREGTRYGTTNLGSRALAGTFDEQDLKKMDARGVTMSDAILAFGGNPAGIKNARRDPQQLLGYAEVHIEQGPVLEENHQPVGVVTGIAGQTEVRVRFIGQSTHAGTTPMALRRDALLAAAQFITAVETCTRLYAGLVATVGQIEARPGRSDVIPGEVWLSVDMRHPSDSIRTAACARLLETANHAGEARGIAVDWQVVREAQSSPCSRELCKVLAKAARQHLVDVMELTSGARHDGVAMGDITPVTMLFVRCQGGITHHPNEAVTAGDVEIAIAVINDFLQLLANQQNPYSSKTSFLNRNAVTAAAPAPAPAAVAS